MHRPYSTLATLVLVAVPPALGVETPDAGGEAKHWAFQPVRRPRVPTPSTRLPAGRTEIDAFIEKELAAANLTPASEADRSTLIRRLTFDLLGLPPAPDDIDAFVADPD